MTAMPTAQEAFTGHSHGIHQLVHSVQRREFPAWVSTPSIAHRSLAEVLARGGERLDPATAGSVFFTEAVPARHVPFLPKTRLLSPAEQRTATGLFAAVLATGDLTSGPAVADFEDALADFLGVPEVVATSSGTDALIIALRGVGIGHGDEVIMPANSFAATENAVLACGAVPVLVDIEPGGHNLDPALVPAAIGPRTKAILPVHLHGKLADVARLRSIAREHGLSMVEDACQAIGVTGVGQYSDAAVLSFNPYKNFGLTGKAGAVVTRDGELGDRLRRLAYHGFDPARKNVKQADYGFNAKIDNAMAAVAMGLLPGLTLNSYRRAFLAKRYLDALADLRSGGAVVLPEFVPDHAWHLFTVKVTAGRRTRDAVREHMRSAGSVETDVYYPVLTHRQDTPARRSLFAHTALPRTEHANETVFQLPLHNNLSVTEQDRVIGAVHAAFHALAG